MYALTLHKLTHLQCTHFSVQTYRLFYISILLI